jgi:ribose transport system permease protein
VRGAELPTLPAGAAPGGAPGAPPATSARRAGAPARVAAAAVGRVRSFLGAAITLVVLVVGLAATQPTFLTVGNVKNVLVTNSSLFVVAAGMTFVMISAGFDLSMGAVMAFSEWALYELVQAGVPAVAAIVAVLAIGFAIGAAVNGTLVGVLRLNFFVVTLGSMTLLYGLVDVLTNGASEVISSGTLERFGNGTLVGVPMPVVVVAVALLLGGFVLRFTAFGRTVYGCGGSREAARLAGIPVAFVVMAVYGVAGLSASLAGVLEASRLAAATPTTGTTIALIGGAAALLGGTSLFGGVGGLTGTVVGVLVIAVLGNGVNLLGISDFWQNVVTGAVLLGAVTLDRLQRRGQPSFH